MTISASTEAAAEGIDDFAVFEITANISPDKQIDIQYNLSEIDDQNQDYIDTGNGLTYSADFRNSETVVRLPIPIKDDQTPESFGSCDSNHSRR